MLFAVPEMNLLVMATGQEEIERRVAAKTPQFIRVTLKERAEEKLMGHVPRTLSPPLMALQEG